MGLYTESNVKAILDRLCDHPSVAEAARIILGTNSKIIWIWARNSAREKAAGIVDSKYIIHGWPDDSDGGDNELIWLHDAIDLCRKIHALNFDHNVRAGLDGIERPVIEGGKVQYLVDPLLIAKHRDAEEAAIFGIDDWPYAHDERGARIVLTVKEQVPAQLKIHALRALMGSIYNVEQRTQADVRHSGGVLVLHGDAPRPDKEATPLRQDLETRLKAIREHPDRPTAKPNAAVAIMGRATGDVPDRVSAPSDQTPTPLEQHPRAYQQPAPQPVHRPAPSYARPSERLDAVDRKGPMPSGGFRVLK